MARSSTFAPLTELVDVSVEDYLTYRRPVPHLLDLSPIVDPMAFEPGGAVLGAPVYATIRARGDRQTDVRLLVDDGVRHLDLASALADNLRCDVYISPQGAQLRFVRESSAVTGDSWDVIAVDGVTGEPVAWVVVRPSDLSDEVPTWFNTVRGRLRQSSGLVTVALPDGVAFATKATFRDTAYLATHIRSSSNDVTTVAVNADRGRFEICRFDDAGSLLDGAEFATLVSACLDVVRPEVQLALTWPTDVAACAALDAELMRFAEALGRTVWVPQPHGAAFVLPGCGDFAAVDEVGSPSVWRPYPATVTEHWRPRFGTDQDGRLVPLGNIIARTFPGVRFVSVEREQMIRLRHIYEAVAAFDGLFTLDLAVLNDGRLGVLIETGALLAIGPRELRALLREAGWSGEDLLLLTQPPVQHWNAAIRHVRSLAEALTVDIWLPARGAQVWVRSDGRLASYTPDAVGPWHAVTYGAPSDLDNQADIRLALPRGLSVATRPALENQSALYELTGERALPTLTAISAAVIPRALEAAHDFGPIREQISAHELGPAPAIAAEVEAALELSSGYDPSPAYAQLDRVPAPRPMPAESATDGVDDEAATGRIARRGLGLAGPHGISWLDESPTVNTETNSLYVWTPGADDVEHGWQLPSAELFLLAGTDGLLLIQSRSTGRLLRVSAPPGSAIDLSAHAADVPLALRPRLRAPGVTHLLPLSWLAELQPTAIYDLDGSGGVHPPEQIDQASLLIRFDGAEHGVPGLPNDVVHWPDKGKRADAPAYLIVADRADPGPIAHRGFVPLRRTKPVLEPGYQLWEIKVRRRKAIDMPATLDLLDGVPVTGRMHDFIGVDLLLPEADLAEAVVAKVWRCGPNGRLVRVADTSAVDAAGFTAPAPTTSAGRR